VDDVHFVNVPYPLVSSMWKTSQSEISFGKGCSMGGDSFTVIAGPCSVESEEQLESVAVFLKKMNINFFRGGVFKPRSSPYSNRGGGIDYLKMFRNVADRYGLKIVTEVMDSSQIGAMEPYVDVFQVGTRNAQNFNLLDALGKVDKPVLLKRGMSGTLEELLQAAEYVFSAGNESVILCERGIRTFEKAYRNTLDLNAVAFLREKSHLPVIVDPSHGVGIRKYVAPLSLAAVAAGANGLIVEIHPEPESASSDGAQTLNFYEAGQLFEKVRELSGFMRSLELNPELEKRAKEMV
jgi:3-deoxy-7-phosphoheptulonate synthase